jgi:hypothetical protein
VRITEVFLAGVSGDPVQLRLDSYCPDQIPLRPRSMKLVGGDIRLCFGTKPAATPPSNLKPRTNQGPGKLFSGSTQAHLLSKNEATQDVSGKLQAQNRISQEGLRPVPNQAHFPSSFRKG